MQDVEHVVERGARFGGDRRKVTQQDALGSHRRHGEDAVFPVGVEKKCVWQEIRRP